MKRNILAQYLIWQFFDVPKEILSAWRNYILFNMNYFSVPLLLRSFFSHWHKYYYPWGNKWDPWRYFEAFVFNNFSRIMGIILRTILIIIALMLQTLIIFIGLLIFIGWLILPALLIWALLWGFKLLI